MNTELAIKDNIYLSFLEKELVFSNNNSVEISLSKSILGKDYSFVIDIYDMDNPVHPEGHLGWWKFDVSEIYDQVSKIEFNLDDGLSVVFNNIQPSDKWENKDCRADKIVINAVVRDSITNGIVYIEKLPGFSSEKELLVFRNSTHIVHSEEPFAISAKLFPRDSKVHIISNNIFEGDAVGNLCLKAYKMMKQNEIPVELYAEHFDLSLNDVINRISELPNNVSMKHKIFYFYSTYDPYLDVVLDVEAEQKLVYYHGITDPQLLQVFDPELSVVCMRAYTQLPRLKNFDTYIANSKASANVLLEYINTGNKEDQISVESADFTLQHLDFSQVSDFEVKKNKIIIELQESEEENEEISLDNVQVISPNLLSKKEIAENSSEKILVGKESGTTLLYVGRMKSHKKVDDILSLFAKYLELDASAKLWLIGSGSDQAYSDYLNWIQNTQLSIPEDSIEWLGHVDDKELAERYQAADCYISMSEHEGFCLPLLEAMMFGIPVFAYSIPAVKEVLGDEGGLFGEKNHAHLASHIHRILSDKEKVEDICNKQMNRASELIADMDGSGFLRAIMS